MIPWVRATGRWYQANTENFPLKYVSAWVIKGNNIFLPHPCSPNTCCEVVKVMSSKAVVPVYIKVKGYKGQYYIKWWPVGWVCIPIVRCFLWILCHGWWECLAIVILAVGPSEERVPKANIGFGTIRSKTGTRKVGFKIIVWLHAVIITIFFGILLLSWSDTLRFYLMLDWGYLDVSF